GTSVRTVFAQVRLRRAQWAVDRQRCPEALGIVDSFERETAGLDFTRGGLGDILQPALMQRQLAAIESACGREAGAHLRLVKVMHAAGADSGPLQAALAYDAARTLGEADIAAWRPRLLEALAGATRTIEAGTSSSPGSLHLAAGFLLRALGREAEAAREFGEVFKLP